MWLVVAALVLELGVPQADTVRNPLANNPSAAVAGRRLYDQACQSCHGPAGQGDRGPALNGATFTHGGADADLFHTIRAGVPGSQMPPFAGFSDEQVWQLVSYIRSLAPRAPTARPQAIAVTTRDGVEIRGLRLNEDTFTLQLVDNDGALHLFDKLARTDVRVVARGASFDRLVHADVEPQNWLMYWGNYQGTHYSALKEIDASNVKQLRAAWTFPMPGDSVLEATPLVVDGVMYTTQPGLVVALDARTGRQIWKYARPQKVRSPYEINPFNRGAAILGNRLFVGTLDAALVALDAATGVPLWETQVADSMLGHSLTSAPLGGRL